MAHPRLVVATRSAHKLAELRTLLDVPHSEHVLLYDLGVVGDVDETGATFEANAALKARQRWESTTCEKISAQGSRKNWSETGAYRCLSPGKAWL